MTPEQSRMARAALNLTLENVAGMVGLNRNSIQRFEAGELKMRAHNLATLRYVYEAQGVEFIGDRGAQLKSPLGAP